MWWPCLLTDQDEMSNLYRRPSIDASYQVSVHLAKGFQRRIKCEKFQKKYPLDPCSKENLDVGFSFYFIFQNGWKQKAFHSFWAFLPFLNPKNSSTLRPTFIKKKMGRGRRIWDKTIGLPSLIQYDSPNNYTEPK
jgi:hypothetical protein